MILAIDPGYKKSAWLMFGDGKPQEWGYDDNERLLEILGESYAADELAVESIASYGMAVGAEVFETCVWVGRFIQRWEDSDPDGSLIRVYRREVKLHLCGNPRAKDANIRQALIDRYGPGKEAAIGKKAVPGPLYGISGDVWAALGVAVTVDETR